MRLAVCMLMAATQTVAMARAQAKETAWLVVAGDDPAARAYREATRSRVLSIEQSLSRLSVQVVRSAEASRRFSRRVSAQPLETSSSDVDGLLADARELQLMVATARYKKARDVAGRLMERARNVRERLERDPAIGDALFRGCLYRVQGALQQNDRERARELVGECRQVVPLGKVRVTEFPPDVVGLVAEVDAKRQQIASDVHIESRSPGCAGQVFLNGHRVDTAPVTVKLGPGEYAVRVDCTENRPGRIHRITIGRSSASLMVDARFDSTVRTGRSIWLDYPSAQERDRFRVIDGARVARAVGATELILVHADSDTIRLDRVSLRPLRVTASVSLPVSRDDSSTGQMVMRAVRALHANKSLSLESGTERAATPWSPPGAAPQVSASRRDGVGQRPLRVKRALAYSVGAAGVGALATAWGLLGRWSRRNRAVERGSPSDVGFASLRGERNQARRLIYGLAPAGGTLSAAGLSLVLPERSGIPWWAWVMGGLGVATASAGVVTAILDGNDQPGAVRNLDGSVPDSDRYDTRVHTALLLSSAAPLFAVPCTYAMRALMKKRSATRTAEAMVDWSVHHATIGIRGNF